MEHNHEGETVFWSMPRIGNSSAADCLTSFNRETQLIDGLVVRDGTLPAKRRVVFLAAALTKLNLAEFVDSGILLSKCLFDKEERAYRESMMKLCAG